MQAFHNNPSIKDKYLLRVKAHAKADEIIKGQYWQEGKGCAVGCTIHSGNHQDYEIELGIPRWLAHLEDRVFEGLPNDGAQLWPIEFLEAINIGADLDKIKIPMLIFICESAREHTKNELAHLYIDGVLFELRKPIIDTQLLEQARLNSRPSYAYAYAAYAAYAAAYAAYAADAAADAAAYAAAYAAYAADAARGATYIKFADKILELIKQCN